MWIQFPHSVKCTALNFFVGPDQIVSFSLLVQFFVWQRPVPLLSLASLKSNPNGIVIFALHSFQSSFHLFHVIHGGQVKPFLSAVALCLVPGFWCVYQNVLMRAHTRGQRTQPCRGQFKLLRDFLLCTCKKQNVKPHFSTEKVFLILL